MNDKPGKSVKLYLYARHAHLHKQAKIAAIQRGITLGQWVAEALYEKLERENKPPESE